jgi:hypothetical protein
VLSVTVTVGRWVSAVFTVAASGRACVLPSWTKRAEDAVVLVSFGLSPSCVSAGFVVVSGGIGTQRNWQPT